MYLSIDNERREKQEDLWWIEAARSLHIERDNLNKPTIQCTSNQGDPKGRTKTEVPLSSYKEQQHKYINTIDVEKEKKKAKKWTGERRALKSSSQ